MSKISKVVADMVEVQSLQPDKIVENFMCGDSYVMTALTTLKMVSASSIFGEPAYYRDGLFGRAKVKDAMYDVHHLIGEFDLLSEFDNKTTSEIMEKVIDNALDEDFGAVLYWAIKLRHEYNMRLNPQVIMVRAAMHPRRKEWTDNNPGKFNEIQMQVMSRADEPATQLTYYLFKHEGKKNNIPSILKRSIAKRLSEFGFYQIAKYKNHEIGIINAVRLTHANSKVIDELMQKGTIELNTEQKTWENLRSEGKSWIEIYNTINIGHMALLRNIRGVFEEVDDIDFCKVYMEKLKSGVLDGKQFPFRYLSAMKAITNSNVNHKIIIMDELEICMDIAVNNMPKIKGKTMCLSDNSGSAWGTFNSEYGTITIAEIDNLSSVIVAACSDEGYVGKFGNRLIITPITKRSGILNHTKSINDNESEDVGGNTEGGIWEFFRDAIADKEHWDNICIFSDMQCGHGQLYGTSYQKSEYEKAGFDEVGHINVFALVREYRKKVNPKVNVFCIQTAGYDNSSIPELAYRTHLMYGWTGRELVYMDSVIKLWDESEN